MARPTQPLRNRPVTVGGIVTPKTPKHQAFCANWLKHYDHNKAAIDAGFSEVAVKKGSAAVLFRRFERYLLKQKKLKEKAVSKVLVLEQKDILAEMKAIGFANAQDYVVIVSEPVKDEKTGTIRMVKRERQKPLMQLTRAQAAAVSKVTFHPDGTVTYELPDEKSKHPYLKDLGQHLGLFHPKLIQEHRHAHAHAIMDLRDMDSAKLAEAERYFLAALGNEGNRMLNIIEGEFEEIPPE